MKLSELAPDKTLSMLLDKQIMVEDKPIRAYANAERPNDNLGTEFLEVYYNGNIQSLTHPSGHYKGNLALGIYSLANSDNTANKICLHRILEQVETLVTNTSSDGIFFSLSAIPITPVTVNTQNGYGYMVLNIEWHTT